MNQAPLHPNGTRIREKVTGKMGTVSEAGVTHFVIVWDSGADGMWSWKIMEEFEVVPA
jgi:hypothetical protein